MNKVKRSTAYFGIHSDFHATADTKDIGAFTDPKAVGAFLDAVKPDYWQIDTKGHPGYASYFTEVGTSAPGLAADYLKIIREETKKRGVLLIAHHSSLWDDVVAAAHPEWQSVGKDGRPTGILDPASPYADEVFIPMLKELAGKYGFDGAWIDGGAWAIREDFNPDKMRRFIKKTGITDLDSADGIAAYREFLMSEYRAFITHACEEVKNEYPNFEIGDNSACTPNYPAEPIKGTDFLSQDTAEYETERHIARMFALTGMPWDIMSWASTGAFKSPGGGFYSKNSFHASTLMRAGAQAISLGGGYEIILPMSPRAEFFFSLVPQYVKVREFVELRRPFCVGARPTGGSVAYLQSECEMAHSESPAGTVLPLNLSRDNIGAALDGGLAFDVETDYRVLSGAVDHRPALVVANKYYTPELKAALLRYAMDGGTLVLFGPDACAAFGELTTAKMRLFDDVMLAVPMRDDDGSNYFIGLEGAKKTTAVFDEPDGEVILEASVNSPSDTAVKYVAAFVKPFEKGRIAFSGINFLGEYRPGDRPYQLAFVARKFFFDLGIKPEAYVKNGAPFAEVIPARKDGKFMVNVIKSLGYADRTSYELPPVNVTVAVRLAAKPRRVMLEPQHVAADFDYDGEYAYVRIPKLDIHTVIIPE